MINPRLGSDELNHTDEFVIQIINKEEVLFGGDVSTITFMRDISHIIKENSLKTKTKTKPQVDKADKVQTIVEIETDIEKQSEEYIQSAIQNDLFNQFKMFKKTFKKNDFQNEKVSSGNIDSSYSSKKDANNSKVKVMIMNICLKNLSDLQAIKRGQFHKNIYQFKVNQYLDEVESMMMNQVWNLHAQINMKR